MARPIFPYAKRHKGIPIFPVFGKISGGNNLNISFDDLSNPGAVFEQYDGKIHVAALKSVSGNLKRKILRVEQQLYKQGIDMAGRQSLRMIYSHFKTDKVSKQLFNVTHLQQLPYPGDPRLDEFVENWFRIEDDMGDYVSDKSKEHILYEKIKEGYLNIQLSIKCLK